MDKKFRLAQLKQFKDKTTVPPSEGATGEAVEIVADKLKKYRRIGTFMT
jgi:hypothetical protein